MRRRTTTAIAVGLLLLGAVFALWGCGAASLGDIGQAPGPTTENTGSSTMASSGPVSSQAPTSSATDSPAEQPPSLSLDKVAYVEISRPSLLVVSAEDRRILSPAIDAESISELLAAYADAAMIATDQPSFEGLEVQLVIHLRSGSAVVLSGDLDGEQPGVIRGYEGRPEEVPQGEERDFPWLLAEVRAPELFAAAERTLATVASGESPGGGAAEALRAEMPTDFGFVAAFGTYGKMVLDTFAGVFHKDMVLPQYTTSTAQLSLTPDELREAYSRLLALNVLSYPTDFIPSQRGGGVTPNEEYYLRLRAGGIEKEIRWDDTSISNDPEAVALRDWFKWLQELVYGKPEYEALPDFRGGYA